LALDPENGPILKELGKVQYKRSDFDGAIATFEKCHGLNAGADISHLYLGKSYTKKGQTSNAIGALGKSIEHKPKNYSAHFALGSIYQEQQKYSKAATEFKAALSANPKKGFRASFNYAVVVEQNDPENYTQNIANWEAFVKLGKNNPKAKKDVAIAVDHIKDLKEALEQGTLQ